MRNFSLQNINDFKFQEQRVAKEHAQYLDSLSENNQLVQQKAIEQESKASLETLVQ